MFGNNKRINPLKKKGMTTLNIRAFKDLSPAQIPELATLCIIINIKTFAIECIIYSKSCIDQSHKVSNIKRKLKL